MMWSCSTPSYLSPGSHTSTRNYSVVVPRNPRLLSSANTNTSRRFFLAQSRFFSNSEISSGQYENNFIPNDDIARGDYEKSFIPSIISPNDIGVKFDDVGGLDPCKGMLLFGPPGTGKTLVAKALATEAGAHFINVTPSSLTSMWHGEEEKLARALFSLAVKLAPTIIFMDEIDALLGARGRSSEHEATRRLRNEFMSAWDGLTSNDSQRILVLGASNRPFDLDDAVIRRMPRRIHVDLPDVRSRLKILEILLAKEALESGFNIKKLAVATAGYSGSDLKNLCVAAAYKPVQELLEQESKGDKKDGTAELRQLKLDDYINSKAMVGPSVVYESRSLVELRKWNEQYGEGGSKRK
ncbi:P-loop containing nucleoside triphosphate hydrolases superfamily protein [Striga hermonthica]|uniref:P-loop containing nucleoside triphosphate hydrolases superfamily protein n=1 Tax=Striga hermonthica TaxID=68872 RepID=A0A9N7MR64_STRHE|nr:P-loop containing nucleoside triphosphate hydrolases superfamily protein [Striga hermonthica]